MDSRQNRTHDYLFRIRLEGTFGVGKTCKTSLLRRYAVGEFTENHTSRTIGPELRVKTVNHENKSIKLNLWDHYIDQRFKLQTTKHFKTCHGILLMYGVTHRESFELIENYYADMVWAAPTCQIFVVGNKIDAENARKVTFDEGSQLAGRLRIPFFEISAKTGDGVTEIVNELLTQMIKTEEKIDEKDSKGQKTLKNEYITKLGQDYQTECKTSTCF